MTRKNKDYKVGTYLVKKPRPKKRCRNLYYLCEMHKQRFFQSQKKYKTNAKML